MTVRYLVENILLINNWDDVMVSPEDGKWVKYNELNDDQLNLNIENISCMPDHFGGKQIWHIYCW